MTSFILRSNSPASRSHTPETIIILASDLSRTSLGDPSPDDSPTNSIFHTPLESPEPADVLPGSFPASAPIPIPFRARTQWTGEGSSHLAGPATAHWHAVPPHFGDDDPWDFNPGNVSTRTPSSYSDPPFDEELPAPPPAVTLESPVPTLPITLTPVPTPPPNQQQLLPTPSPALLSPTPTAAEEESDRSESPDVLDILHEWIRELGEHYSDLFQATTGLVEAVDTLTPPEQVEYVPYQVHFLRPVPPHQRNHIRNATVLVPEQLRLHAPTPLFVYWYRPFLHPVLTRQTAAPSAAEAPVDTVDE